MSLNFLMHFALMECSVHWLNSSDPLFSFIDLLHIISLCPVSRSIESSEEMRDFDRVCIYVDNQFQSENSFTVRKADLLSQST